MAATGPRATTKARGRLGHAIALATLVTLAAPARAAAPTGPSPVKGAAIDPLADPDPLARTRFVRAISRAPSATSRALLERATLDPDAAVRAEAVRALGRLATGDEAKVIVARLDDEEPAVRRAAADLAAVAPEPKLLPALLVHAGDDAADVRVAVAEALGELRGAGAGVAHGALVELLADRSLAVRAAAMHALARQGEATPDRRAALVVTARSGPAGLRAAAIEALVDGAGGAGEAVAAALVPLLDDEVVAGPAADAIARLGRAATPALLRRLATGRDPARTVVLLGRVADAHDRAALASLLAEVPRERVPGAVLAHALARFSVEPEARVGLRLLADSADPIARAAALDGLAAPPSDRDAGADAAATAETIAARLADADALVRRAAVRAAGRACLASSSDVLVRALDDRDSLLAADAARALARLDLCDAGPRLVARLARSKTSAEGDTPPEAVALDDALFDAALAACDGAHANECVGPLAALAQRPSAARADALRLLGLLAPDAVAPIAAALLTKGDASASQAEIAVAARALAASFAKPDLAALVARLFAAPSSTVALRRSLVEGLGLAPPDEAARALLARAAADRDATVRATAAWALRRTSDTRLLASLASDPDPAVRANALAALVAIAPPALAPDKLVSLLVDGDAAVRANAARLLRAANAPGDDAARANALALASRDGNPFVRVAASATNTPPSTGPPRAGLIRLRDPDGHPIAWARCRLLFADGRVVVAWTDGSGSLVVDDSGARFIDVAVD